MSMDGGAPQRPRLVFFRPKYGATVPAFLCIHRDDHLRCLQQFFQVQVIDEDCDFVEVCDVFEPDLCLMEIGLQLLDIRRPTVRRIGSLRPVPVLGLMNADAWGQTRSSMLAETEAFDFDAVFSICTTTGEHFPELRDRLFYWPNFIAPETFHDYKLPKSTVVLLTGSTIEQYPWRRRIAQQLKGLSPTQLPHAGYIGTAETAKMPVGKRYAQALAAAWFAPTCGTVANELVRKHLEIPAVGTCLITERSESLDCAGFRDMENVVYAEDHDVLDKIQILLQDADKLSRLIKQGQMLVQTKHSASARAQILEWFLLRQRAAGGQRMIQSNPFGPITLARDTFDETRHVEGHGIHLRLMRDAKMHIAARQSDQALIALDDCKRVMPIMLDIEVLRAHCLLTKGRPKEALRCLVPALKASLHGSDTSPPDPMEWAYLLIALLALGRVRSAYVRAREFSELSHPVLNQARAVVFFICRRRPPQTPSRQTRSIHDKPAMSAVTSVEWMLQVLADSRGERSSSRLADIEALILPDDLWGAIVSGAEFQSWPQCSPLASRRLRRWDNPLARQAIAGRLRSTASRWRSISTQFFPRLRERSE